MKNQPAKDPFWRDRALCLGVTHIEWVPSKSEANPKLSEQVDRFCRDCPVRVDCLRFALKNQASGYWGGTSSHQRAQLTRIRDRAKCPLCRGTDLVLLPEEDCVRELCIGCGMSWTADRITKTAGEKTA